MSRRNSGFEHRALKPAGPMPSQASGTDLVARRTSGFDHRTAGPTPSLQGSAARRASGFDQVAVRRTTGEALRAVVPSAAGGGPVAGVGTSIPPLTPAEQQRMGAALPPNGGPQVPWGRNDGVPEPTALAGTMMARAQAQGLLPQTQIDRSADVANRSVPTQDVRQVSSMDVAAMAREAGIPVERLDAGQMTQAARLINGATSPQDQRDRIALSLNNLSVAANGQIPQLSRKDMEAIMWAEAKVPAHATQGLTDAEVRSAFLDVTRAVNQPGTHALEIGQQNLELNVAADGSLQGTRSKRDGVFTRAFAAIGTALAPAIAAVTDWARKNIMPGLASLSAALGFTRPNELGPAYPTTPEARAQDQGRLEARFGPAIAQLPPYMREVIDQLRGLGIDITDMLRGSHVIIADGGANYERWSQLGGTTRTSSHYSGVDTQQFELDFPGVGPMLFGKDASGNTWFQFEAHPLSEGVEHFKDYLNYLSTGLSIGPGGTSPHLDANPIRVGG